MFIGIGIGLLISVLGGTVFLFNDVLRKRENELNAITFLSGVYIELAAHRGKTGNFPPTLSLDEDSSRFVDWSNAETRGEFVRAYHKGKVEYSVGEESNGYQFDLIRWERGDKIYVLDSAGGVSVAR